MNEPAEKYVPHTSSMLLVDTIIEHHDDGGLVEATFKDSSMFTNGAGIIDPIVFIEILAQGFAALNGYTNALNNSSQQKGFLVGLKSINFYDTAPITSGTKLTAKLELDTRLEDFAMVKGTLFHNSTILMDGIIKLFILEAH